MNEHVIGQKRIFPYHRNETLSITIVNPWQLFLHLPRKDLKTLFVQICMPLGFENYVNLPKNLKKTNSLKMLWTFNKCVNTRNIYVLECSIMSKLLYAWYIVRTLGFIMRNIIHFFVVNITLFNQGNHVMSTIKSN